MWDQVCPDRPSLSWKNTASQCVLSARTGHNSHHPFKHSRDVREAATTAHSLSLQPESIYHQTDGFSLNKHTAVVWRWRSLCTSANLKLKVVPQRTGQLRRMRSVALTGCPCIQWKVIKCIFPCCGSIYDGVSTYTLASSRLNIHSIIEAESHSSTALVHFSSRQERLRLTSKWIQEVFFFICVPVKAWTP